MKFIHLERDVRAMPLKCSASQFFYEWEECWKDPHRDTARLYGYVRPFLDRWAAQLRNPTEALEINFVSMMSLLQSNGDPFELVHNWVQIQDTTTSVEDELTILFFERLRNVRFIPKRIDKSTYSEYLVARDFKLFLRNRIRDCWTASNHKQPPPLPEAYEPEYPDWFMITNLGIDTWNSYLADYIMEGRTKELQQTMSWSNHQLSIEVNRLCQPLKKLLQSK